MLCVFVLNLSFLFLLFSIMGSSKSKVVHKNESDDWNSFKFLGPLDVEVKKQMTCIITHWIRECGQTLEGFPVDVVQFMVDTFAFQHTFGIEHRTKIHLGNDYYTHFLKHYTLTNVGPLQKPSTFKVIITGESGVGKSKIVSRFIHGSYEETDSRTIGVDFTSKSVTVDGIRKRLQIWDTSGQTRFRQLIRPYYTESSAVIVVFDVTNQGYLKAINQWTENARNCAPKTHLRILIGNKTDLTERRAVSVEDAQILANERGYTEYIETSAKTDQNVETVFKSLAHHISHQIERVQKPWCC